MKSQLKTNNKQIQNKKWIYVFGFLLCLVILIVFLYIQNNDDSKKIQKDQTHLFVAMIDNDGIPQSAYEVRLKQTRLFFKRTMQSQNKTSSLEKDVLNQMINEALIRHYAKQHAISVSPNEVAIRYEALIKQSGSKETLLKKLTLLYGTNEEQYLTTLTQDILQEKVQEYAKQGIATVLETQRKKAVIQILRHSL